MCFPFLRLILKDMPSVRWILCSIRIADWQWSPLCTSSGRVLSYETADIQSYQTTILVPMFPSAEAAAFLSCQMIVHLALHSSIGSPLSLSTSRLRHYASTQATPKASILSWRKDLSPFMTTDVLSLLGLLTFATSRLQGESYHCDFLTDPKSPYLWSSTTKRNCLCALFAGFACAYRGA